MGVNRDLKKATEAYWGGKISQSDLLAEAKRLRLEHWNIQKKAGVDVIPSNDFALYDQVLTHIQDFGVSTHMLPHLFPFSNLALCRLLLHVTQHKVSTLSMNTLLWAVVTKRTVSTFQV
jgi:hypothetical protein